MIGTERLLRLLGMHHRCLHCGDRIWSLYYYDYPDGRRSHGPCHVVARIIDRFARDAFEAARGLQGSEPVGYLADEAEEWLRGRAE